MLYKTVSRLLLSAGNGANGFPARLLAVIYRLASAITQIAHPVDFRWYRAMPLDAAVALPGGRTLAVVRQGNTADRAAFAKRLWRLGQGSQTSAVLLLLPDKVRLRQARRLAAGLPAPVFLALEGDAVSAGAGAAVWRTPSGPAALDLATALAHTGPRRPWPLRRPPQLAALPGVLDPDPDADCLLPSLLKPVEKRAWTCSPTGPGWPRPTWARCWA